MGLLHDLVLRCNESEETEPKIEDEVEEEEEEGEGEVVVEEYGEGRCMVICVISLLSLCVLFRCASSLEESESVASWSVRMIRTNLCFVLRLVLLGGSPSKFELEGESFKFNFSSFSVDCTDMLETEKCFVLFCLCREVSRLFDGLKGS